MTQTNISVVFGELPKCFYADESIEATFSYHPNFSVCLGDFIGLYEISYSGADTLVAMKEVPQNICRLNEKVHKVVVFENECLRGIKVEDGDFYQLCYIRSTGAREGSSFPFFFSNHLSNKPRTQKLFKEFEASLVEQEKKHEKINAQLMEKYLSLLSILEYYHKKVMSCTNIDQESNHTIDEILKKPPQERIKLIDDIGEKISMKLLTLKCSSPVEIEETKANDLEENTDKCACNSALLQEAIRNIGTNTFLIKSIKSGLDSLSKQLTDSMESTSLQEHINDCTTSSVEVSKNEDIISDSDLKVSPNDIIESQLLKPSIIETPITLSTCQESAPRIENLGKEFDKSISISPTTYKGYEPFSVYETESVCPICGRVFYQCPLIEIYSHVETHF